MKSGEMGWVAADKRRPGIVLALKADRCVVIYGTGTHRPDYRHVCIDNRCRAGKVLGLSKPTYFYARSIVVVPLAAFEPRGLCPVGTLHELEALCEE